jgi:FKBP-type peptidyl-prolyl cis-trans isomerase FklB
LLSHRVRRRDARHTGPTERSFALPIPGPNSRIRSPLRSRCAVVLAVVLLPGICSADERPEIEGPGGRAGYSLGHQIGGDLERAGNEGIDADALLQGLRDALQGKEPSISTEEMNAILVGLKKRIKASERDDRKQTANRDREEGREFLAANAKKEGVVSLPSGLQYRVLREGTGRRPDPSDQVKVHYRSTLIDGTEFHNSYQREAGPETLHVSGVTRGLTEALQLMREGARWQLFVPADLAFGRRGPLADRTVIYEIELVMIEPGE